MANIVDIEYAADGPRNAIVRISGVLDTSDVSLTPVVAVQDFLSNENERAGKLVGFRVDFIEWSISNGIEILLEWNSTIPKQILAISGRGKANPSTYGGLLPDSTRAGYDGNINLKTSGFGSITQQQGGAQNFSVFLELVKIYGG